MRIQNLVVMNDWMLCKKRYVVGSYFTPIFTSPIDKRSVCVVDSKSISLNKKLQLSQKLVGTLAKISTTQVNRGAEIAF